MYLPKHFAETDVAAMHALMRAHPLATVVQAVIRAWPKNSAWRKPI